MPKLHIASVKPVIGIGLTGHTQFAATVALTVELELQLSLKLLHRRNAMTPVGSTGLLGLLYFDRLSFFLMHQPIIFP